MQYYYEGKGAPILGLDVWEHSYYIEFRAKRGEFIDHFLKFLVNWEQASGSTYLKSCRC
jgi:Fe-Mn family superoxide dismutase